MEELLPLLEEDDDDDDDDDDNGDEEETPEIGTGKYMLLRELIRCRAILVSEVVTDKLARNVLSQALLMERADPDAPITVYINSPGGSADSGFAIYDVLRFVRPPVRMLVTGLCASAAVTIFLAGDKGNRLAMPNSRFLLHQPSTSSMGDASDIEITAKEIIRLKERYNKIVSEATGKPAKRIAQDADRDFWLSAQQAMEYGLVDRIVEHRGELD